jgi:aspartate 1-decarboxylase
MKTFLCGKIHGLRVTDKSVEYHGSVGVSPELLKAAGMEPYERVLVANLNNGQRWWTYIIVGAPGEFRLNGAAARLGEVNDRCLLMTFETAGRRPKTRVVHVNESNQITSCEVISGQGDVDLEVFEPTDDLVLP